MTWLNGLHKLFLIRTKEAIYHYGSETFGLCSCELCRHKGLINPVTLFLGFLDERPCLYKKPCEFWACRKMQIKGMLTRYFRYQFLLYFVTHLLKMCCNYRLQICPQRLLQTHVEHFHSKTKFLHLAWCRGKRRRVSK